MFKLPLHKHWRLKQKSVGGGFEIVIPENLQDRSKSIVIVQKVIYMNSYIRYQSVIDMFFFT